MNYFDLATSAVNVSGNYFFKFFLAIFSSFSRLILTDSLSVQYFLLPPLRYKISVYNALVCDEHSCLLSVFVVGTAALKGDDGSSLAEQSSTSSGDYTAGTVALAIALGAALAVLVIIIIVFIVRRVHASQRKNAAERQHANAAASRVLASVSGSLPSWDFDSIRSKYSITSEASVDDELS